MKKLLFLLSLILIALPIFAQYGDSSSTTSNDISLISIASLIVSVIVLIIFLIMANNISTIKKYLIPSTWSEFWELIAIGEKQKARLLFIHIVRENDVFNDMRYATSTESFDKFVAQFEETYKTEMAACELKLDYSVYKPKKIN